MLDRDENTKLRALEYDVGTAARSLEERPLKRWSA
jgi:hypothetical protein